MGRDGLGLGEPPARPLRLALFSGNYNYTVDGANRALNRLVGHLERRGFAEVRVYSPTTDTPAFPPAGVLVPAPSVPIPFRPDYRLATGMTAALRRDVEAFGPDLIHLSSPDLLGAAAQAFGRGRGIPVVASVHTMFGTYLAYYGLGFLRPLIEARLRRFYAACDYVLAPTPAIADQMRRMGAERVRMWPRGVDGRLFSPDRRDLSWRRAQGFSDEQPVVVFCGRLVMEKGLGVFVETMRRLRERRGDLGVLVVGDGPAMTWLRERLPGAVFTGFLCGEALARAIASGDVLLNPSATEAFCNVTLEAMASGLAPVCADGPNTRAVVVQGETGLVCPARDGAAYAAAIERLVEQPLLRRRIARAARAESARYGWDEILDRVAGVYREAAARRTAPARPSAAREGPAEDALRRRA